jgi:hypothetical protein
VRPIECRPGQPDLCSHLVLRVQVYDRQSSAGRRRHVSPTVPPGPRGPRPDTQIYNAAREQCHGAQTYAYRWKRRHPQRGTNSIVSKQPYTGAGSCSLAACRKLSRGLPRAWAGQGGGHGRRQGTAGSVAGQLKLAHPVAGAHRAYAYWYAAVYAHAGITWICTGTRWATPLAHDCTMCAAVASYYNVRYPAGYRARCTALDFAALKPVRIGKPYLKAMKELTLHVSAIEYCQKEDVDVVIMHPRHPRVQK